VVTQETAVVSVVHLDKVYESRERRVEAIGDLSFEVRPGDFTCIGGLPRSTRAGALVVYRGIQTAKGKQIPEAFK
jgi:ABC-type glutathione transport system ATPase component